jgi:hypothetical protein
MPKIQYGHDNWKALLDFDEFCRCFSIFTRKIDCPVFCMKIFLCSVSVQLFWWLLFTLVISVFDRPSRVCTFVDSVACLCIQRRAKVRDVCSILVHLFSCSIVLSKVHTCSVVSHAMFSCSSVRRTHEGIFRQRVQERSKEVRLALFRIFMKTSPPKETPFFFLPFSSLFFYRQDMMLIIIVRVIVIYTQD